MEHHVYYVLFLWEGGWDIKFHVIEEGGRDSKCRVLEEGGWYIKCRVLEGGWVRY